MIAVPRILNRLYGVIHGQTVGASGVKGALARRAFSTKLANFKATGKVHHPLYDRLMMNKIKAVLGGRIKLIGTGSAPLSPDVLDFLQVRLVFREESMPKRTRRQVAFCCNIQEGYGQTETTGCSTKVRLLS
jgi:long-chain acyl-CoA synthetase